MKEYESQQSSAKETIASKGEALERKTADEVKAIKDREALQARNRGNMGEGAGAPELKIKS